MKKNPAVIATALLLATATSAYAGINVSGIFLKKALGYPQDAIYETERGEDGKGRACTVIFQQGADASWSVEIHPEGKPYMTYISSDFPGAAYGGGEKSFSINGKNDAGSTDLEVRRGWFGKITVTITVPYAETPTDCTFKRK